MYFLTLLLVGVCALSIHQKSDENVGVRVIYLKIQYYCLQAKANCKEIHIFVVTFYCRSKKLVSYLEICLLKTSSVGGCGLH
jgi:hypothetical protein